VRALEDLNPITAAVYFLAVSGIAMFSMNPVLLVISLAGAVLFFLIRNGSRSAASHLWMFGLFLLLFLVNPLFSHNGATVLFVLNDNPVTLEATVYGAAAAVMVVSVLYWFRSFTQIMTSDKLLYLFGSLSPKLALVMSMGLRYVPLFSRQASKIGQAQTALGLYKDDNLVDRFRGGVRIFSVLVTWALENGIVTADSMAARGFGCGRRSRFSIFRFTSADVLVLTVTLLLFASAAVSLGSGALLFTYYPSIKPPDPTPLALSGCISYGLLALLPSILEAEEKIRWTCLKLKI